MMARLMLAPPWEIYAKELVEMFRYDKQVHVVLDAENYVVHVYVDSEKKAEALGKLLPESILFGNVTLNISVVPPNSNGVPDRADIPEAPALSTLYLTAFNGNSAFAFLKTVKGIFPNDLTYVVFKNKVVQYYNDDLGDVHGKKSTLYQDIAEHVFAKKEGVFFCTDVEEPVLHGVERPLGEWP